MISFDKSHSLNRRKMSECIKQEALDPCHQEASLNKGLIEENIKLRCELEAMKQKLQAHQARDKVLESQIWDLRRLMKRIASEGYTQLQEVEARKDQIEEELLWIKSSYKYYQNYLGHFERVGLYWAEYVNGDQEG